MGKPYIAEENSVCSQTFLYAVFDSVTHAVNFVSYYRTKLFRAIVSAVKITQHAQSSVYRFVPMQDYSRPWTDADLYEKYGLSASEIEYIETNYNSMESTEEE